MPLIGPWAAPAFIPLESPLPVVCWALAVQLSPSQRPTFLDNVRVPPTASGWWQGLSFLHVPVWAAVYRVLTIAKWPAASHLSCNNCVRRLMNLLTVAVSYTLGHAVGKLGFWQGEESLCSVL